MLSIIFQPRLGPKPFSMGSGDVSFDKVFAVPQAPGLANTHDCPTDGGDGRDKSTESSDSSLDEPKDSNDKEGKNRNEK